MILKRYWLLMTILFLLGIADTIYLGLHNDNMSGRMLLHALPTALSVLYHGHINDYTALKTVADIFYANGGNYPVDGVNAAINRAITVKTNQEIYFWGADDRGLRDFVIISFKAFGPKISSLIVGFWSLFGLLLLIALFQFRRDPQKILTLSLLFLGCILSLGFLILTPADFRDVINLGDPVFNIYESRAFDVIALIPAFALVFGPKKLQFIVLNTFLIALILFMRSTVAHVLFAAVSASLLIQHKLIEKTKLLGVVFIVILGLQVYKNATFNPLYFNDQGTRTVWHNIVMGLADTDVGKRYQIELHDPSAVAAVVSWIKETNDPRRNDKWVELYVPNTFGYPGFDVNKYEISARDFILSNLTTNVVISALSSRAVKIGKATLSAVSYMLTKNWPAYGLVLFLTLFLPVNFTTAKEVTPFFLIAIFVGCCPSLIFYFSISGILATLAALHALFFIWISALSQPLMNSLFKVFLNTLKPKILL
jgi:hypothetical protein